MRQDQFGEGLPYFKQLCKMRWKHCNLGLFKGNLKRDAFENLVNILVDNFI
jgi:hypothetical protein